MEVSALHPPTFAAFNPPSHAMENQDMDIDMDIDLGPVDIPEEKALIEHEIPMQSDAPQEEQIPEIPNGDVLQEKIHIRGLDNLTTSNILQYVKDHLTFEENLPRLEWIDDTSANLIFTEVTAASQALDDLCLEPSADASLNLNQVRTAKPLASHPESNLRIRFATTADIKRPRAHESSRFYMLHPEHDPRERRRKDTGERRGSYPRSRRDRPRRPRREDSGHNSNGGMQYDESRRNSRSSLSSASTYDNQHSSRRRSASPSAGNRDSQSRGARRRTPPPPYRSRDPNPFPRINSGKELFPVKTNGNTAAMDQPMKSAPLPSIPPQITAVVGRELFPNKAAASAFKKELFPMKTGASAHRRSMAFDAADETADLFASGMNVPFVDGSADARAKSAKALSLADRISSPLSNGGGAGGAGKRRSNIDTGGVAGQEIRIQGRSQAQDYSGFSIRGRGQDSGFSIRGAAFNEDGAKKIKELFPEKRGGNVGKELFADRVDGRAKRNKAADLFG
ncbi:hypothetical protein MMC25_004586 [Agyrium rufum]|nr:hypothetical protein [Agyrium rufum]